MKFMACTPSRHFPSCPGLTRASTTSFRQRKEKTWMAGTSPAMTQLNTLHPRHIELRLLPGAVAAQGAVFADRVVALKDPVLPRRQAREDFRFHGLGTDEAQIGFHAGESVGRKAGALLEEHPDLVVPVDVVERKGDEAELFGLLGIERLAGCFLCALQIRWIGLKARLQPRQAVAHRIGPEVHR